jgi:hypothetical protein
LIGGIGMKESMGIDRPDTRRLDDALIAALAGLA